MTDRLAFENVHDENVGLSKYVAIHGRHYYELRGHFSGWRVFHSNGRDVFITPEPIGGGHKGLEAAMAAAEVHLTRMLAEEENHPL